MAKQFTEQRLGMIAGISMFSVSDGMLQVMEQTGRQQVDCSRDAGQQQQMSDRRQWQAAIGGRQEDWRSTSAAGLGVSTADRRRTVVGRISTEMQCRGELGIRWPPVWTWCARALEASGNWQEHP